ncbi:MAG: tRNA modification GTPase [Planctomycetes bacterium]|nr:tRNA modification GTPase [Planctomycetota bacterium]
MSAAGDTICAIASPPGRGQRGVIRISGDRASAIVEAVWRGEDALRLEAGRCVLAGRLFDGQGEQPLLLLWMPGPRSFTREDVAELHLPGAAPLLERALARLVELGGRLAEPGEFTRRAFESGRIDLSRAEGVLSLVEARSEAARRSAVALLFGGLDVRVGGLRDGLSELRALCESSLDFDSTDTSDVPATEIDERLRAVEAKLEEARGWEAARGVEAGAPRVVLVGAPNAGKSTLFNALGSGTQEAIVSDHPGTTRDRLERAWRVGALEVELADLAGIEEGVAGPDEAAQRVGAAARDAADHVLWVVDARRGMDEPSLLAEREDLPAEISRTLVWAQCDRAGALEAPPRALAHESWVGVSAQTGHGLSDLAQRVAEALERGEGLGVGRELSLRHSEALGRAATSVQEGRAAWEQGTPLELLADELRVATDHLDEIAGRTTPEDLLDRIFARFCLGK